MAQRVNIVLIDDLDGGSADETVSFGLDGQVYEIDLTTKNASKLRTALAPYVAGGRRVTNSTRRKQPSGPTPADVRTWAQENGMDVPERGRVSQAVRDAYVAAH